jgi:ABC-type sugar transport system ATPase subunit
VHINNGASEIWCAPHTLRDWELEDMIVLGNVTAHAGPFGLGGISLEIPRGHCAVLMGRTACGKTTILETLCGLKPARDAQHE